MGPLRPSGNLFKLRRAENDAYMAEWFLMIVLWWSLVEHEGSLYSQVNILIHYFYISSIFIHITLEPHIMQLL